jgi:ABC-type uncharacterized transport system ATPase subunit
MIEVERLRKWYRVHQRAPGLAAALRSLFRRRYETVKAVDDVSFSIAAGERVGFLGPNGAGKTTTLKVLSGLLHPTEGRVAVAGFTPKDRARGFLQQITLVMGQKQQLLWDIGLDVSMQATVRGFVRAYNERFAATVLLTSHYMEDVAALCPRVMVIDKGRLIYDGGLAELVRRVRPDKRMLLRLGKPVDRRDLEPLGTIVEHGDAVAVIQVSQEALQSAVARALSTLPLHDLTVEDPPLEEVMRDLFAQGRAA